MGQIPSSSAGEHSTSTSAAAPTKTCYYELLSIDRSATPEEIKKAYRKKALELHPDRNFNDVDRATRLFAEIQTAHEVLSDPQERAWYDSHRDAILGGTPPDASSRPADITTAEDVLGWFSQFSVRVSYDDNDPRGFFAILRCAFEKLADEEIKTAEWEGEDPVHYPGFGGARDTYENGRVRDFYLAWTNFQSKKSFSWCDLYRYSDAPDRRTKRAMERENIKARETARREFNDTVVSFVKFVRKRDPRFTPNTQTEAQRQAALLKLSKEQAARHRKENAERRGEYKAAGWTQVDVAVEEEPESGEEDEEESEEEEMVWECVVCDKMFRSQGQMDAHEKSKKHVKAVQQLKRQMMKENKEFDLDRDVRGREKAPREEVVFTSRDHDDEMEAFEEELLDDMAAMGQDEEDNGVPMGSEDEDIGIPIAVEDEETGIPITSHPGPQDNPEKPPTPAPKPPTDPRADSSDSDEYVSTEKFSARVLGVSTEEEKLTRALASTTISDNDSGHEDSKPAAKQGKAKAKRAKRAQKAAAAEEQLSMGSEFNCASCGADFPSKTKLFNHLKENPGHAKLVPAAGGRGGKKKKGKSE